MSKYLLPNHASLRTIDALGICDGDREAVSHQQLLRAILMKADRQFEQLDGTDEVNEAKITAFVAQWNTIMEQFLQDVAHSLHSQHDLNVAGIRELDSSLSVSPGDRRSFQQNLFRSLWQTENLFPHDSLLQLSDEYPTASFSVAEVDTLLAHLFVGTLQVPQGNTWGRPGFIQYLDGRVLPVVRNTALPYWQTIFLHFVNGGYVGTADPHVRLAFHFSQAKELPNLATCQVNVVRLGAWLVDTLEDPRDKNNDPFVLIAANAQPGPGPGGTHEERLVGQSPALAIASLLCPVLDPTVAIVTSAMPVHASWQGHGRSAEMQSIYPTDRRPLRRYIIADALPLDLSHRDANLRPGNVEREVRKLYAAFYGAFQTWLGEGKLREDLRIEMPPWGCGAFGGSLVIKMPCMMMAAGLAGLSPGSLELLVTSDRKQEDDDIPRGEGRWEDEMIRDVYASLMAQQ